MTFMIGAPMTEAQEKIRYEACRNALIAESGGQCILEIRPTGSYVKQWVEGVGNVDVCPFMYVILRSGSSLPYYIGDLMGAEREADEILREIRRRKLTEQAAPAVVNPDGSTIAPYGTALPTMEAQAAEMKREQMKRELRAEIIAELKGDAA